MTYDEDTVSDLHKDAYGFRPRGTFWSLWKNSTDAEKQADWDRMIDTMNCREKEREEDEVHAAKAFEVLVTKTINSGAKTRESALRWIMDASRCDGDWEYLCFTHGLPYHYFKIKEIA